MHMTSDGRPIVELAVLCPGEPFTRIGAPHVVYVKSSHTWASLTWKGRRTNVPMHHTTLVARADERHSNP